MFIPKSITAFYFQVCIWLESLDSQRKKKIVYGEEFKMNADPHQHARSNDCLTNFLTLNTQLLFQSVLWESYSRFLDCKTKW